jgi:hypothetical protein
MSLALRAGAAQEPRGCRRPLSASWQGRQKSASLCRKPRRRALAPRAQEPLRLGLRGAIGRGGNAAVFTAARAVGRFCAPARRARLRCACCLIWLLSRRRSAILVRSCRLGATCIARLQSLPNNRWAGAGRRQVWLRRQTWRLAGQREGGLQRARQRVRGRLEAAHAPLDSCQLAVALRQAPRQRGAQRALRGQLPRHVCGGVLRGTTHGSTTYTA